MGKQTEVIISARCGAAARQGTNEDNCLIMTSVGDPAAPIDHLGNGDYLSEVVSLGRNGCLLVVADGMGGMNAGEVASQLAVDTIATVFRSEKMSKISLTDENIRKCIRLAILKADKVIRETGMRNPDQQGMGTTVALLWLVQGKAYYGWCGDSRIYRYYDGSLSQLSSDHSYVCEVLHLSAEESFNHPENNIITRSLGNPNEEANPEVSGPEPLRPGELFLLCSDGLCGVLRNSDLLDDLQSASSNPEKLNEGNLRLWENAEIHNWHDNVTSLLCYVKSCPEQISKEKTPMTKTFDPANAKKGLGISKWPLPNWLTPKIAISILCALLILLGMILVFSHKGKKTNELKQEPVVEKVIDVPQAEKAKNTAKPTEKQTPQEKNIPENVEIQEIQHGGQKSIDLSKLHSDKTSGAADKSNPNNENTNAASASSQNANPSNSSQGAVQSITGAAKNKSDKQE